MARCGQGKQEETAQLLYAVEGVEVWIDAHPQGAELSTKCVTDTWGAAAPLFLYKENKDRNPCKYKPKCLSLCRKCLSVKLLGGRMAKKRITTTKTVQ